MKISIFGAGYVGVVSAACCAARGHTVICVDINRGKVDLINRGMSPIVEKELPELLSRACADGLLSATDNHDEAILSTEISLVCVGTPSRANGSLNTVFIENVCRQIGRSLRLKAEPHIVVFRSTTLPGTTRGTLIPILEEASGKQEGKEFFVAYNPEFLREATAVFDFNNPPKTVVGAAASRIADRVVQLYEGLPGPMIKTGIETAEMVKYVDNAFHALKVTFANETGHICKQLGINGNEVMNIFVQDHKLNLSPYYLKPGFAFGGSCLPKDLRAINYMSKMLDLDTPLLSSLLTSNNIQILATIKKIIAFEKRKIGFAGFSFKAGTDDLRESPMIEVIETLLGKGYDIKLYDKNVLLARLIGANKDYIINRIPHIASLMVDSLDALLADRELIVIGNNDNEFKQLLDKVNSEQILFDLVGITDTKASQLNYEGICW